MQTASHDVEPDVSVIIPVYNAMPYLTDCLRSMARQTIGTDRVEVITIDDGSTDQSGEELDRWASENPWLRVVHQASSGGPSRPRNRGLDMARGRYVYFVDADDWLGDEALQRMVGMADRCGSDVLLGKLAGAGGRNATSRAFRKTLEDADLFTSDVYRSLTVFKLFRREVLERHGLRFPEDMWYGEDQVFTASAYFEARTISVLADYDCYYWRSRDDGAHVSSRQRTVDEAMQYLERMVALVARRFPSGPQRDALMLRHLRNNLDAVLRWVTGQEELPDSVAFKGSSILRQVMDRSRAVLLEHGNDDLYRRMPVLHRLKVWCVLNDRPEALVRLMRTTVSDDAEFLVEGGSVYADLPGFRDPSWGAPDSWFDVTHQTGAWITGGSVSWRPGGIMRVRGEARFPHVHPSRTDVDVVLRERELGTEVVRPGRRAGTAALDGETPETFIAEVPTATEDGVGTGIWDVFIRLRTRELAREKRLRIPPEGDRRLDVLPSVAGDPAAPTPVVAYSTKGGYVAVDVGGRYHPFKAHATLAATELTGSGLRISGTAWIDGLDVAGTTTALIVRRRDGKMEFRVPTDTPARRTEAAPDSAYAARLDVASLADGQPLSPGVWDLFARLEATGGVVREVRLGRRRTPDALATLGEHEVPFDASRKLPLTIYLTKYDNISLRVGEMTVAEASSRSARS
jgi:glycosyltransferase involved in cell wall biosynthesis